MGLVIATESPRTPDVVALLERHHALMRSVSPPEHVHALDVDGLCSPDATFLTARSSGDGSLLAVGALKQLDPGHAEMKSMHTAEEARGQGVARQVLDAVLALARSRGCARVSLETETMAAFEPARTLYASVGFVPCPQFGSYWENEFSTCMTLALAPS